MTRVVVVLSAAILLSSASAVDPMFRVLVFTSLVSVLAQALEDAGGVVA